MEKFFKYLMLMLIATFSLTFVSCSGNDDEPDNPQKITSVSYLGDCEITLSPGCRVARNSNVLNVWGGLVCYAGVYSDLSQINYAPDPDNRRAWSTTTSGLGDMYIIDFKEGGYIIYTYGHLYYRLLIKYDEVNQTYNYKFQQYTPSNID